MLDIAVDTFVPHRAPVRGWLTSTELRNLALHGVCGYLHEHILWLMAAFPNNMPFKDRQIIEAEAFCPTCPS